MSEARETSRSMVAELRFGPEMAGMAQVGSRSIHQYWHLLAAHFRDILLAPQRRFDDAGVAWTWREVAGNRPPSAADLVALRKRLTFCNESFGESAEKELGKHDSAGVKSRATLSDLRAAMSGMVASLVAKPDPELGAFVARTELGLMLHSWGSSVPAKPASPEAHEYEVSGCVIVGTEPVAGYEVALENRKGLRMSWMISDASGWFGFPAVGRGEYRIRVISDRVPFPSEGTLIKVERGPITNLRLCSSTTPAAPPEPTPPALDDKGASEPGLPSTSSRKTVRFVLMGGLAVLAVVGGRCAWNAKSHSQQIASLAAERTRRESISPLQGIPQRPTPPNPTGTGSGGAGTSSSSNADLGLTGSVTGHPGKRSSNRADGSQPPEKSASPSLPNGNSAAPKGDKGADPPAGNPGNAELGTASSSASESEFTSKTAGPALGTAGGTSSVFGPAGTGGLPPTATGTPSGAPAAIDGNPASAASLPAAGLGGAHSDKNNAATAGSAASDKPSNSSAEAAPPTIAAPADSSESRDTRAKKDAPSPVPTKPGASTSSDPISPKDNPKKISAEPAAESPSKSNSPAPKDSPPPPFPTSKSASNRNDPGLSVAPTDTTPPADSQPRSPTPEEPAASPGKGASLLSFPAVKSGNAGSDPTSSSADTTSSGPASTMGRDTPEPNRPTRSKEKRPRRAKEGRKTDESSQPADDVRETPLHEKTVDLDSSTDPKKATYRLLTHTSAWELRLLGDLILPTRPMRADEEEAVDVLRTQLLKERRAQIPPALAHPRTWCGYALELVPSLNAPEAALPQWRCLDGPDELEATVRPGRAEIAWPGETVARAATYALSSPEGAELARFAVDKTGAGMLTTDVTVRSWVWFGVEGTFPDRAREQTPVAAPRYEWQCLSGSAQTADWQRDDAWRNGSGARIDLPPSASGSQTGVFTLAFVDRLSGWALVRDVAQSSSTAAKTYQFREVGIQNSESRIQK